MNEQRRSVGAFLLAAVASLVITGCETTPRNPSLSGVTPSAVTNLIDYPVAIEGADLQVVRVDLEGGDEPIATRTWAVTLIDANGGETSLGDATAGDDLSTLNVVVPAQQLPGDYAIRARAGAVELVLAMGALNVSADPVALVISIEDQPDGTGSPIGNVEISQFQALDMHAVARNPFDDSFVAGPIEVTWSVEGDIGDVSIIDGPNTRFTGLTLGVGKIRAAHPDNTDGETGDVTVGEALLAISELTVDPTVDQGERNVVVTAVVTNGFPEDLMLTASGLRFVAGATDLSAEYAVVGDSLNPSTLVASSDATLRFYVDVDSAATAGDVELVASVAAFVPSLAMVLSRSRSEMTTVGALARPTAIISAPLYPADRICAGDSIDFDGASSINADTFAWVFDGGNPTTSTDSSPQDVSYAAIGSYPYRLTVNSANGASDTALGPSPIFVGESGISEPAGSIVIDIPGAVEAISSLPAIDMLGDGDPSNLQTCSGAAMLEGDALVTVFVDRGEVDVTLPDADLVAPGVQQVLHQGSHFDDVPWLPVTPMNEGETLVYAEYRRADGVVTSAGHKFVTLTDDDIEPTAAPSFPPSCVAACYGRDHTWRIEFSERMNPATAVSEARVSFANDPICDPNVAYTDITANSTISYDDATRTLEVTPEEQNLATYSVRVEITAAATDASSNGNNLAAPFLTCSVVEVRTPAEPAAPESVTLMPAFVSPDGDGVGETIDISATVDANTAAVRLDVEADGTVLYSAFAQAAPPNVTITWNGRDGTGRALPNGFYVYRLTAINGLGQLSPEAFSGIVEVRSAVRFIGVPKRF